jgi:hypothetical protein
MFFHRSFFFLCFVLCLDAVHAQQPKTHFQGSLRAQIVRYPHPKGGTREEKSAHIYFSMTFLGNKIAIDSIRTFPNRDDNPDKKTIFILDNDSQVFHVLREKDGRKIRTDFDLKKTLRDTAGLDTTDRGYFNPAYSLEFLSTGEIPGCKQD